MVLAIEYIAGGLLSSCAIHRLDNVFLICAILMCGRQKIHMRHVHKYSNNALCEYLCRYCKTFSHRPNIAYFSRKVIARSEDILVITRNQLYFHLDGTSAHL
ncbi:hypothetical protein CEXT_443661 [Caerostris extrusa]|uniref:Secreted protein n=1 Tax=Caerostris extrusa TaxID=172846 RepID=A0AAV4XRW1_CAEEX|nr:hypothetical protein CEXT_443661 [Caerostris extrusa]